MIMAKNIGEIEADSGRWDEFLVVEVARIQKQYVFLLLCDSG
jgi:hypothetical protein